MMKFDAVSRYCQGERKTIQLLLVNLVWGRLQLLKGLSYTNSFKCVIQHDFLSLLLLLCLCLIICEYFSFLHNFGFSHADINVELGNS